MFKMFKGFRKKKRQAVTKTAKMPSRHVEVQAYKTTAHEENGVVNGILSTEGGMNQFACEIFCSFSK